MRTELNTLSKSVGLRIHSVKSKVLRASTTHEEAIVLEGKALVEYTGQEKGNRS